MKKLLVILVPVLCLSFTSAGQFKFGVKAGVNFANFQSKDNFSFDNMTAWQAGIMAKFKIPIVGLGVQPELLYTVNKAENVQMDYFQLPIMARMELLPGPIKPVLFAGPYFSYAANVKIASLSSSSIEKFDWGLGLGAGVEIINKVQVALRYTWGLQNITSGSEIKGNAFSISAGLFF